MINITFIIAGNTPGAPPPIIYKDAARRFAETYKKFPADYEHKLYIIDSNGGLTPDIAALFVDIPHEVIVYRASGYDIGAHLYAAYMMPPEDWIMCFSSWAHFKQRGWLKAFVDARGRCGDGIFGSTSSFENNPHLRGTGFFVRCEHLHRYPYGCNSKNESFAFESGPDNISLWCLRQNYGAWLVTLDEVTSLYESRRLNNIFRRGDQSNIWTFDKHTDLFDIAKGLERVSLSNRADGIHPPSKWQRRILRIKRLFLHKWAH